MFNLCRCATQFQNGHMNSESNPVLAKLNRREFISTSTAAAAGVLAGASALAQGSTGSPRKRYALVGVGSRSGMYRNAVLKDYAEHAQMVGYCDINLGRLQLA